MNTETLVPGAAAENESEDPQKKGNRRVTKAWYMDMC